MVEFIAAFPSARMVKMARPKDIRKVLQKRGRDQTYGDWRNHVPKELVTFTELLMSNTVEQEALVNLLVKRGLISKEELLEEIKKLRDKPPVIEVRVDSTQA